MKLAHVNGRAALVLADGVADIERATAGRLGPQMKPIDDDRLAFADVARNVTATGPLVETDLGCPVSTRHVLAIGIDYRAHSEESGATPPEVPDTFAKLPTCLAGPYPPSPSNRAGRIPTVRPVHSLYPATDLHPGRSGT